MVRDGERDADQRDPGVSDGMAKRKDHLIGGLGFILGFQSWSLSRNTLPR